jgi:hypothetical protein
MIEVSSQRSGPDPRRDRGTEGSTVRHSAVKWKDVLMIKSSPHPKLLAELLKDQPWTIRELLNASVWQDLTFINLAPSIVSSDVTRKTLIATLMPFKVPSQISANPPYADELVFFISMRPVRSGGSDEASGSTVVEST